MPFRSFQRLNRKSPASPAKLSHEQCRTAVVGALKEDVVLSTVGREDFTILVTAEFRAVPALKGSNTYVVLADPDIRWLLCLRHLR